VCLVDKLTLHAKEQESPTRRFLEKYLADRKVARGKGEGANTLVMKVLAWQFDEMEGAEVKTGENGRRLKDIRMKVENARPLKQFSDAAGGLGVFLVLEKGFREKYVIFQA